jgi:hypothetical protein
MLQTLIPRVEELKPNEFSNYVAYGNWEKLNHFVNKQISNWHNKQIAREQEVTKKVINIKPI